MARVGSERRPRRSRRARAGSARRVASAAGRTLLRGRSLLRPRAVPRHGDVRGRRGARGSRARVRDIWRRRADGSRRAARVQRVAARSPTWSPVRAAGQLGLRGRPPGGAVAARAAAARRTTRRPTRTDANFYGISHFPCCLVGRQGWPKFALHAPSSRPAMTARRHRRLSSRPRARRRALADGATVQTDSDYPFGDTATVTVRAASRPSRSACAFGWAVDALVVGAPAQRDDRPRRVRGGRDDGDYGELRPRLVLERGWGRSATARPRPARGQRRRHARALVFALRRTGRRATQTFDSTRPRARPRSASSSRRTTRGLALVVDGGGLVFNDVVERVVSALSWDEEHPFSITARAARRDWGFFEGTQLDRAAAVARRGGGARGPETEITLVPFEATNLRIGVFRWTAAGREVVAAATPGARTCSSRARGSRDSRRIRGAALAQHVALGVPLRRRRTSRRAARAIAC